MNVYEENIANILEEEIRENRIYRCSGSMLFEWGKSSYINVQGILVWKQREEQKQTRFTEFIL